MRFVVRGAAFAHESCGCWLWRKEVPAVVRGRGIHASRSMNTDIRTCSEQTRRLQMRTRVLFD